MRYISETLDQFTGICKEALHDCAAKLSKSFESFFIEVLLLYMVIPGNIDAHKLDCAFIMTFATLNEAKVMMKETGSP